MFKGIVVGALTAILVIGIYFFYEKHKKSISLCPNPVSVLRTDMRKLWEDHIVYTRNYIISDLAKLDDAKLVADRLLKNQDDIGNAIKPIYGDEAGAKLTSLLREHILLAVDVLNAAKAKNKSDLENSMKEWYANADEIADFLSKANPHWQKGDVKDMLDKHLQYTTDEATARLKKDWQADIEAYDKNHTHMLMFSDMLVDGIVKQFPAKFRKSYKI